MVSGKSYFVRRLFQTLSYTQFLILALGISLACTLISVYSSLLPSHGRLQEYAMATLPPRISLPLLVRVGLIVPSICRLSTLFRCSTPSRFVPASSSPHWYRESVSRGHTGGSRVSYDISRAYLRVHYIAARAVVARFARRVRLSLVPPPCGRSFFTLSSNQ